MEIPQVCQQGAFVRGGGVGGWMGAQSKTGGHAAQTHFPLPAGAECESVTLTSHYHSKEP